MHVILPVSHAACLLLIAHHARRVVIFPSTIHANYVDMDAQNVIPILFVLVVLANGSSTELYAIQFVTRANICISMVRSYRVNLVTRTVLNVMVQLQIVQHVELANGCMHLIEHVDFAEKWDFINLMLTV